MIPAGEGPRDPAHRSPDHRTGDQIPEHSPTATAGRGEGDQGDGEHRDEAAERPTEIPPGWPARDPDQEADQQPRAVEGPDRDRPLDPEDVELVGDRAVDERRQPGEGEAEDGA